MCTLLIVNDSISLSTCLKGCGQLFVCGGRGGGFHIAHFTSTLNLPFQTQQALRICEFYFFRNWPGKLARDRQLGVTKSCCAHNYGATPTNHGFFLHPARESSLLKSRYSLLEASFTLLHREEILSYSPHQSCNSIHPLKGQNGAIFAENRPIWAASHHLEAPQAMNSSEQHPLARRHVFSSPPPLLS